MRTWQHRTPDQKLLTRLILIPAVIPLIAWVVAVAGLYTFPKGMFWAVLMAAFKATPKVWILWAAPLAAFFVTLTLVFLIYRHFRTNFEGPFFLQRFNGPAMMSVVRAKAVLREEGRQLRFCGLPIPRQVESLHFQTGGSTGSGKSVAMSDYLHSIQQRSSWSGVDERIICIDPDGGYMKRFYQPGDVILNPFDSRGQGWSIFNEIRTEFDCEQFAVSMIPKSPSTDQEAWNSMARTIVSEMLNVLMKQNMGTTENLVHYLCIVDNSELKNMMVGTPAAGFFHGAEETLASIRTVLTQYITPHKFLSVGAFSVRKWLESGRGNLWVTWSEETLQALKPLVSCWTDTIIVSALSMSDDEHRRCHILIDELDSLEKLNYIVDGATKGRKKGLRFHVGYQSLAQLDKTYGRDEARTLRNSFRNMALFGVTGLDDYTSEGFSKALGKHVVSRRHIAKNDSGRDNKTYTRDEEFVVSQSSITSLPPNSGFMRYAGDYPIVRFSLKPKTLPIVVPGVMLSETFTKSYAEKRRSKPLLATERASQQGADANDDLTANFILDDNDFPMRVDADGVIVQSASDSPSTFGKH